MASLSINLDARKESSSEASVRLCITHNNTKAYIKTGVYLEPQYVSKDAHNPIIFPGQVKSMDEVTKCSKAYEVIMEHVRKCDVGILELTKTRQIATMSATDIRNYVYGEKVVCIARQVKKIGLLKDQMDAYTNSRKSDKYKETMEYAWKLMNGFREDVSTLPMNKLTTAFLKDFDLWMQKRGLGIGTRGIVFRNIKAVCNDAIDRDLMSANDYPFRKFKMPKKKKCEIDYLTIEDMQRLLSLDLRNHHGEYGSEFARDVLMISFYCCGANFKDICLFNKPSGDEIVFVRSKISYAEPRPVHIKILPELQMLIDKYSGDSHLFNFGEKKIDREELRHKLNKRCKCISELLGRPVNMKIIRHTWATLCYQNGTDKTVVDKSLGHVDKDVSDVYYIQYDWDMTYKANRSIVDKIHACTPTCA